jgi:zinc transport system ATP-binding protein
VLLLDEPVAGLDPIVTQEMYELIRSLNEDGTAIIMISHDISTATDHARHILHMGSKGFFGTKEDYFASETGRLFLTKQNAEKHFANALLAADKEVEDDG